jgi:hypothetical protein
MRVLSQRGSSLLFSVLVVAILTVIGVAMVRFAAREQAGAVAKWRQDALASCARAAANVLKSQFGLGVAPSGPLDITMGDPAVGESVRIVGGHVDQDMTVTDIGGIQVTTASRRAFGGAQSSVGDLTNTTYGGRMTGSGYSKVLAHCQMGDKSGPATGRQVEVELMLRVGL